MNILLLPQPSDNNRKENLNLKTSKSIPHIAEMKDFEDEIQNNVNSVKFKHGPTTELRNINMRLGVL